MGMLAVIGLIKNLWIGTAHKYLCMNIRYMIANRNSERSVATAAPLKLNLGIKIKFRQILKIAEIATEIATKRSFPIDINAFPRAIKMQNKGISRATILRVSVDPRY